MNNYLSKHAWNMTLVFEILNDDDGEFLENNRGRFSDESNEVIDSLVALADEQEPTVAQLTDSAYMQLDMKHTDWLDLKVTERGLLP